MGSGGVWNEPCGVTPSPSLPHDRTGLPAETSVPGPRPTSRPRVRVPAIGASRSCLRSVIRYEP